MKAKVTSGIQYVARTENGIAYFAVINGEIVVPDYNHERATPLKEAVKGWTNIQSFGDRVTVIGDKVYFDTVYEHDGDYYTEDEAIEAIRDDDDRFREWCDDNSEYVTIMGVDFNVDYDTLDAWGILDEVKESYDDDVPEMLTDGGYGDWEEYESDDDEESIDYYITDDGDLIEASDINRDYVAQLLDIIMAIDPEVNRFGDWVVTKDVVPVITEPVPTPIPTVDDNAPKITLTGVNFPVA